MRKVNYRKHMADLFVCIFFCFIGYLLGEKTTVTVAFNSFVKTRRIIKDWVRVSTELLKKSSFCFCVKENHFFFNGQTDAKLKLPFLRQSPMRISLMVSLGRCPHFSV